MNILVIKLGAKGDVVRTLPVLIALKEAYPNSEITWITKPSCREILEKSPYINHILLLSEDLINSLGNFDLLFNFDVEEDAVKLAGEIKADKKYGFFSDGGYPLPFNSSAEYYLNTIFDDNLKKTNKKTYQQMMFETAELPYRQQHHSISLTEKEKEYAEDFARRNNLDKQKLIGIHIGSSPRWPSKAWHQDRVKEFVVKAKQKGYEIILFGGPDESERYEKFSDELKNQGIEIFRNNPSNTDKEFFSLINLCRTVICGDSFALHISLALKKPTICLFFCTSPSEVEGYELLTKLISPSLYDFFPERQDQYSEELTKSISADEVLNALEKNIPVRVVNAIVRHPHEEKFLVIKRSEGIHKGKWAFPGGIIEENENSEEALKRELKEETGLELKNIIKKISEYSYPRQDGRETTGTSYLIEVKADNVLINGETEEFKWITIEEFEELDSIEGLDKELLSAFSVFNSFKMEKKIKEIDEIEKIAEEARKNQKKVITTNGCFDILHYAHVRLFEKAKNEGDLLIVLLNCDDYLRKTKGIGRPVVSQYERARMIAALESVDYVMIFHEDTPLTMLKRIKPHIHVKGGSYVPERIRAEEEMISQWGGRLKCFELEEGYSTTNIIEKILKGHNNK